uniref:GIY-YIG domain-containing protein n=1 Tax=Chlamydomonas reinhardtii TaxID=3055 RepID=Q06747_CHLRE|nr:unknown [Chlamydomonas reinhardtii]
MNPFGQLSFHQPFIYNEVVDLSSDKTTQTAGESIVKVLTPIIDNIISAVLENKFDYSNFLITKQQASGLTNRIGLYLLINSKTKRIYLGGASDLAQRKGDHHRCLNDPDRAARKLATSMRDDLKVSQSTDFFFVPLLIINNISGVSITDKKTPSVTTVLSIKQYLTF